MNDDLDPGALDAELDAAIGRAQPELDPADEAAGWRIKPKSDAAEPPTDEEQGEAALSEAYDKIETGDKDDRAWQRELRKMTDAALERAGINPADRHAAGISRREVVRRVLRAEETLRSTPDVTLSQIAREYAGHLAPEQRAAAGARVLSALGFDVDGLADAHRQELQAYRERSRADAEYVKAAVARLEPQVAEFAKARPDFAQLRPAMSEIARVAAASGQALSLEQIYNKARVIAGLPSTAAAQEAAAQAEAEARRSKAAQAQNARTPRSRSVSVPETEVEEDIDKIMSATFDQIQAGGG